MFLGLGETRIHSFNARLRDLFVLRWCTCTAANRANDFPVYNNGDTAPDVGEAAVVRSGNGEAVCGAAGSDGRFIRGGGEAVASGREGFVDGDVDGGELGEGEAGEVEEVELCGVRKSALVVEDEWVRQAGSTYGCVNDSYVHGYAYLF